MDHAFGGSRTPHWLEAKSTVFHISRSEHPRPAAHGSQGALVASGSPLLSDVLSQKQGSGDLSLFVIRQGSLRNTRPRFSLTVFPGRGAYLKNSVGPYLYRGPGKGFGIISLFKNTGKRSELDRGLFHAASYPIHLIIVSSI